jgi:hypothetical protein
MMKAMRALTRYAAADIEETGLGLSDFGVLELLLRKGPLPVNTIGPMVDLTPGSISIAVGYPMIYAATWKRLSNSATKSCIHPLFRFRSAFPQLSDRLLNSIEGDSGN